jgi:hypothetical protein
LVVNLLDRLLAVLASLKMAIVVILSLAAYLALATFYEAKFGGPAVQTLVYGSPLFVVILLMLSINVAAAVIVRYPWKRRQTGFIITHLGIEVLLAGCLISMRQSTDGKVELRQGQTIDRANLNHEHLFVSWGDPDQQGGQPLRRSFSADYFAAAGFPGPLEYLIGRDKPKDPPKIGEYRLAEDVKLSVDQWLPAARFFTECQPAASGPPAVKLRLHGRLPNGMEQDQSLWLHSNIVDGAVAQLFGGVIEATLWKASQPAEVEQFLKHIDLPALGNSGRLSVYANDAWHAIDVEKSINAPVDLGNDVTATVLAYYPAAMDDNGQIMNVDTQPRNPVVRVRLKTPLATDEYVVSARYPFTTRREKSSTKSDPKPALMVLDHAAIAQTQPQETRGRLQLLQGPDGKLYLRQFGLRGMIAAGPMPVGQDFPAFMSLKVTAEQHLPHARQVEGYVAHNLPAKKMGEAMRAAQVTLDVAGEKHTLWLARGAAPVTVETAKGPVMMTYTFDSMRLPFSLSLKEAKMTKDPGSDNPASYESRVIAVTEDGASHDERITMNEPATFAGLTFYQQGFNELEGKPIVTLSVRRDPGWGIKYAGCGLIVAGIFTMFYMKAYFQKPRTAAAATPEKAFDPILAPAGGGA